MPEASRSTLYRWSGAVLLSATAVVIALSLSAPSRNRREKGESGNGSFKGTGSEDECRHFDVDALQNLSPCDEKEEEAEKDGQDTGREDGKQERQEECEKQKVEEGEIVMAVAAEELGEQCPGGAAMKAGSLLLPTSVQTDNEVPCVAAPDTLVLSTGKQARRANKKKAKKVLKAAIASGRIENPAAEKEEDCEDDLREVNGHEEVSDELVAAHTQESCLVFNDVAFVEVDVSLCDAAVQTVKCEMAPIFTPSTEEGTSMSPSTRQGSEADDDMPGLKEEGAAGADEFMHSGATPSYATSLPESNSRQAWADLADTDDDAIGADSFPGRTTAAHHTGPVAHQERRHGYQSWADMDDSDDEPVGADVCPLLFGNAPWNAASLAKSAAVEEAEEEERAQDLKRQADQAAAATAAAEAAHDASAEDASAEAAAEAAAEAEEEAAAVAAAIAADGGWVTVAQRRARGGCGVAAEEAAAESQPRSHGREKRKPQQSRSRAAESHQVPGTPIPRTQQSRLLTPGCQQ